MNRIIFILLYFFAFSVHSQVFWTENFGTTCSGGLSAIGFNSGNGAWAVTNTGTNNSSANAWFVSAKERGMGVGVCGAGCGGTQNRTLHIGSTGLFLDLGASYNETGAANATDKRVESPVINCTGKTTITLAFNYMEFGQGTFDNATLWYFDGAIWTLLIDPAKTLCCGNVVCTGLIQGLWTAYSIALPASANNNANVKIGFRWVNNGNGVGTDPSIAVDDITLSTPVIVPIELIDFSLAGNSGDVKLKWETATEKNGDKFEIEKSDNGISFIRIGEVKAAGESYYNKKYAFSDPEISNTTVYYRLKIIDKDKSYAYSKLLAFENDVRLSPTVFFNPIEKTIYVSQDYSLANGFNTLAIYNGIGQQIMIIQLDSTTNHYTFPDNTKGLYYCVLEGHSVRECHKIVVQ